MERLLGKVFSDVKNTGDEIHFYEDGVCTFKLKHMQDCCESVDIDEIHGDLSDLVGTPILLAEESYHHGDGKSEWTESNTWSFYKLATVKGHVTIKFYGESNGYYSESADLIAAGEWGFNY